MFLFRHNQGNGQRSGGPDLCLVALLVAFLLSGVQSQTTTRFNEEVRYTIGLGEPSAPTSSDDTHLLLSLPNLVSRDKSSRETEQVQEQTQQILRETAIVNIRQAANQIYHTHANNTTQLPQTNQNNKPKTQLTSCLLNTSPNPPHTQKHHMPYPP